MKLVEAMSYFLPIVTTQQCADALFMENNVNAFISDDPVEYAGYVVDLLDDPQLAQRISNGIEATYKRYYSKAAIYSQLDSLFGIEVV